MYPFICINVLLQDFKVEDYVPSPTTEEFSCMKISTAPDDSVVPYTTGNKRRKAEQVSHMRESLFICLFAHTREGIWQ